MRLSDALLTPTPPPGLWLLCGPPASGKSTFRETWWRGAVVSPDELRLQLLGRPYDPEAEGMIWARVRDEVERLLAARRGVLLDATNVERARRVAWVRVAQAAGLPAYALVCWDPQRRPLAWLLQRNAARTRQVPPDKLRELAEAWEPPTAAEGFAGIWSILTLD